MQRFDSSNTFFTLAWDLVNHTSKNIFLTGKAGTGKTTFLKYIRENCPKQMVVVAPTGVAAINAGGVTIHSFFQLPFGPFIPADKGFSQDLDGTGKHDLLRRLRLNSERRKILQELELLIIDEISMVRCDVLDAIDLVLRHVRYRNGERFGGVQLLFIGDMFQLPPVVKEPEWAVLREYYQSPYFFDSQVMKEDPPIYIEFTKIYRQADEKFIALLNKVRNNEMDEESLLALHDRYQPEFFGEGAGGFILLTTHNEKARQINAEKLAKLQGKIVTYKAEIIDDFAPASFPADEQLELKPGAQVMFIRNDTDKSKRYFNGKIGVVTKLAGDKIMVQCKGEEAPIEVGRERWENIHYTLDKATREVKEEILGIFSQYPLRLAWAITIHKSQGLTFERAVIDAGKAFAPGQVYVALSRCMNLVGLVLHSRIQSNALCTDERIVRFTRNLLPPGRLQLELIQAKKTYQENIIFSLFDFQKSYSAIKELQEYLAENTASFNEEAVAWVEALLGKIASLQNTSEKFGNQLQKLFELTEKLEDNTELQGRIKTAAGWFLKEIKFLLETILGSPAITDSSVHARQYNDLVKEVHVQLARQQFLLQGFETQVDMENYHHRKKSFVVPSFSVNAYAGASEKKVELAHPGLYFQLKQLRDGICSRKNQPIYLVAGSKTLEEMASYLPQTLEELQQIRGFGKAKAETYGNDFLEIIRSYCGENHLSSNISAKTPKRKRGKNIDAKPDTKTETFELYRQGRTVLEIARQRNLTVQTIEGHLSHYVQQGAIKIEELVSPEKLVLIEPAVKDFAGGSITPLRQRLGSKVSFGEIRLVLASVAYRKSSSHVDH